MATSVIRDVPSDKPLTVATAQLRTNYDGQLPVRLWHRFAAKFASTSRCYHSYYILVGKTKSAKTPYIASNFSSGSDVAVRNDPRGELRGLIFIIDYGRDKTEHKLNKDVFTRACEMIVNAHETPPSQSDFINICCKMAKSTVVKFRMFRTGEVWFEGKGDAAAENIITDVRQAYLFLKDCAHIHHHHTKRDDQFIPVIEKDDNDFNWRRQTLWDLVKSAGQMRRQKDWRRRARALGVLAYAQSFQQFLARIRRQPDGISFKESNELATFSFEHQKQSMEAAEKLDLRKLQARIPIIGFSLASIYAALSLFILIIGKFNNKINYSVSPEMVLWNLSISIVLLFTIYDLYVSERSVIEYMKRGCISIIYFCVRLIRHRRRIKWLFLIGISMIIVGLTVLTARL